jgi:hypothetical protein
VFCNRSFCVGGGGDITAQQKLFALSILFFFIGFGIIVDLFSIQPIEIGEFSAKGPEYDGEAVEALGYISPSKFQLNQKVSFEEEVSTYVLEYGGEKIWVVYPGEADRFVYTKGKFFLLNPALGASGFIYVTEMRGAWEIEEWGLSKEGLVLVVFYSVASGVAFLYELKKTPIAAS